MSALLKTALLATVATAQLTTQIWMPGTAGANQSFVGSVVSQQSDRTTIALTFDGKGIETEYYQSGPSLVTVGGITYVGYGVTATDPDSSVTATVNFACSRSDALASPTCTADTDVNGAAASSISGLGAAQTTTTTLGNYGQYYLNEFKLVITAGTEKLSASVTTPPTASGSSSSGSSAQSSGISGVAQATGAAAPMRSLAPVLAGMGAAAVFFV